MKIKPKQVPGQCGGKLYLNIVFPGQKRMKVQHVWSLCTNLSDLIQLIAVKCYIRVMFLSCKLFVNQCHMYQQE